MPTISTVKYYSYHLVPYYLYSIHNKFVWTSLLMSVRFVRIPKHRRKSEIMKWLLKVIYFILCKMSVSLAYFDIHKWLLKKNTEVSNCQTYSSNVSLLKMIRWYQCKQNYCPRFLSRHQFYSVIKIKIWNQYIYVTYYFWSGNLAKCMVICFAFKNKCSEEPLHLSFHKNRCGQVYWLHCL